MEGGIISNNKSGNGGGVFLENGRLDMRGGTVTGNSAALGPGIGVFNTGTVSAGGELILSGQARVLDFLNPIYLHYSAAHVISKITLGTFTGDLSGPIAWVTLASPGYSKGTQILDGDLTHYGKFGIIPPSAFTIGSDGKLQ
jgi:hypothetical protein